MRVKVKIIITGCMLISEAVTVPSLTMMTSTASEKLLTRDRHTDRHTDFCLVYFKLFWKVVSDFENKKANKNN